MLSLRSISYKKPKLNKIFPHNLPIFQNFPPVDLGPVTNLIGENGTGKELERLMKQKEKK